MAAPTTTSRKIVIDNATLSGVERLTGASQTLNLNYIDNDILCLEKLVTAILFSDSLFAVDDYKSDFRAQRLKNFEFIQFNNIKENKYKQLTTDAASFAREMAFFLMAQSPPVMQ